MALLLSLIALAAPGVPVQLACNVPDVTQEWGIAAPGEVVVVPWICKTINRRWRADGIDLALAVKTVLHEGAHIEQYATYDPANVEHAAECEAVRLMPQALARLGVHRRRRDVLSWFTRSTVLYEPAPYGGRC